MVIPSLEAFIFATTSVLVTGVKLSSEVVMLGSLSTFKVPAVISAAFNVPLIVAFGILHYHQDLSANLQNLKNSFVIL